MAVLLVDSMVASMVGWKVESMVVLTVASKAVLRAVEMVVQTAAWKVDPKVVMLDT